VIAARPRRARAALWWEETHDARFVRAVYGKDVQPARSGTVEVSGASVFLAAAGGTAVDVDGCTDATLLLSDGAATCIATWSTLHDRSASTIVSGSGATAVLLGYCSDAGTGSAVSPSCR